MFYVKGVNVVARNGIRKGGAVGQIFHIFIHFGPSFIAAVDITLGVWKVTISRGDILIEKNEMGWACGAYG